jgi:hypothetical protein
MVKSIINFLDNYWSPSCNKLCSSILSAILIVILSATIPNYATLLARLSFLSFIFPSLISSVVALSMVFILTMFKYLAKVTRSQVPS